MKTYFKVKIVSNDFGQGVKLNEATMYASIVYF